MGCDFCNEVLLLNNFAGTLNTAMQVQCTSIKSEKMESSLHAKGVTHNLGSKPGEEKVTLL